jgi:hypothetical protein
MDAIAAIRECCVFDEDFKSRVDRYVIAHPEDFERWTNEFHPNIVVPALNEREETVEFAMRIAPLGDSEFCRILASLDSRSLDFCAANSPPLRPYNFKGEKRQAFEERLASYDIFVGGGETEVEEPLDDSRYMKEHARIGADELTPERIIALIKMYEWEVNVAKVIDELRTQVDVFLGSKQTGELPQWVEDSMHAEKTGMRGGRDGAPDACGNWGIPVTLTTCPICGMRHNLGESVASVAVFPCGHTYHVSCLHTRHCPVCYSGCMD